MNKQSQFARRCRGPLYKQTQFRRVGPIPGGPIAQNKAKLGKAGACGQRPSSCAGRSRQTVERAKQTQFPLGPDGSPSPSPSQLRETNPICPAVLGSVVQTNPIWRARARGRVSPWTNKANWPERIMRNEANLGRRGRCPQANSAEQSQFRQSAGVSRAIRAKQSQTWASWGIWGRRAGGASCVKQSQFPAGSDGSPPPPPSQLRQTNPICPAGPSGTRQFPVCRRRWRFCAKNSDRQPRRRDMVAVWAGAPENAVFGRMPGVYLARGTWLSGFLTKNAGSWLW
jgi:hypothetical protein